MLTVNVQQLSLVELLDELALQAGFAVVPCVACEQTISLRFDSLPLHQGLVLILRDQNFVLRWHSATGAALRPHKLWLLPQAPRQPRAAREVAETRAATVPSPLAIGTPEQRADAATAMAQGRKAGAVASLTRALNDSDRQVRQAALESLAEIGGADAVAALGLALRDGDARMREAAVHALSDLGGPTVKGLLQQAQHDASSFVRLAATEALADLQGKRR